MFLRVRGNYVDLPDQDFLLELADVEAIELRERQGIVYFRTNRTPFFITQLGTQPFSGELLASILQEAGYL